MLERAVAKGRSVRPSVRLSVCPSIEGGQRVRAHPPTPSAPAGFDAAV